MILIIIRYFLFKLQLSSEVCRVQNKHIEPSGKFTQVETDEFLRCAQILAARNRQYHIDSMNGKTRRKYKRWNPHEKHTLLVALALYGAREFGKLANIMEDRSENQVLSDYFASLHCHHLY